MMASKYNFKKYFATLGVILIFCFILTGFIVAFTFDPPNENNVNELKYIVAPMLGNIFFYVGVGLLIISGIFYFKEKVL
jgi:uncharacterized membrane protein YozB (DUF420 family)